MILDLRRLSDLVIPTFPSASHPTTALSNTTTSASLHSPPSADADTVPKAFKGDSELSPHREGSKTRLMTPPIERVASVDKAPMAKQISDQDVLHQAIKSPIIMRPISAVRHFEGLLGLPC